MSCGCSDPSSPQQQGTSGNPGGTSSNQVGSVVIPKSPCSPPPCPQPFQSDQVERPPYCPTWVKQMLNAVTGKLIVALDDCLYTLRSKCSGWLYHDAGTGTVSVQTPPFVSSNPQETNFGFLAKVVPTTRSLCSDDSDQCAQELVQELAAQKLDQSSVGQIIVGRPPMCNEIGPGADASSGDQTHLSYLDPADYKGCPVDAFLLIGYPAKIGSPGQQVEVTKWAKSRRLRFPKSLS